MNRGRFNTATSPAFYVISGAAILLFAFSLANRALVSYAASNIVFSNNFEDNDIPWAGTGAVSKTSSGTSGITSSAGSYHGLVTPSDDGYSGPHTQFGGYNSQWPGEWEASMDVYLDPSWPVDTGFIYSVATNNTAGTFLRDYIFHAGVINDESTSNTNKLILIADNHGAPPNDTTFQIKHPSMHDRRVEITQAGWYTISHNFYNKDGRLVVDIKVTKNGATIKTWTLDAINADPQFHVKIPENVGGNRYGWFTHVTVPDGLAIDNVTRAVGSNIYNVGPDATGPTSIILGNNETAKLLGVSNGAVTAPVDITIANPTSSVQVLVPAGTEIVAGSPSWDGTILAPAVLPNDSVTSPGKALDISLVVRVGANTPLSFSAPVKLVLAGQAGKKAGYVDASNVLHPIDAECAGNPAAKLVNGVNECYEVQGNDLIIWTNHFSTFAAYSVNGAGVTGAGPTTTPGVPNTGLESSNTIVPVLAAVAGILIIKQAVTSFSVRPQK